METNLYKKAVNENFKRIREQKGLSATQVADILGVSQAKISYIENGKGILSAADVAILSRRLGIPVTEFFQGISESDSTGVKELIHQLVRFGATLLAKPKGITTSARPFEDVFVDSLSFLDDPRLHQAFHAALITQTSTQDIHPDRIFAQIGGSPFLLNKALKEIRIALEVVRHLSAPLQIVPPRAKSQLRALEDQALEILKSASWKFETELPIKKEIVPIITFVTECLHAKK